MGLGGMREVEGGKGQERAMDGGEAYEGCGGHRMAEGWQETHGRLEMTTKNGRA
jgi:hypothetical protein